jgi:hypothetical protein
VINKICKNGSVGFFKSINHCSCLKCKEQGRLYMKEYNLKNKEKNSLTRKKHYEKNKESILMMTKAWKTKNNVRVNAINAKRRALKNAAIPTWYGELDDLVMIEAHDLTKLREKATGIKWDVDHMIPLKAKNVCGLHCARNIQVIPEKLNCSKGNSLILMNPFEWI